MTKMISRCINCGAQWPQGTNGAHSCSASLRTLLPTAEEFRALKVLAALSPPSASLDAVNRMLNRMQDREDLLIGSGTPSDTSSVFIR